MSGQHLPLRRVSEDRGGDLNVARLIRTEKEVEGRYEEVWIVVEEDALDQWPAGPLRRRRAAGAARRRARARPRRGAVHRRPAAAGDAARRRAAQPVRARARDARSTSSGALAGAGRARVRSARATATCSPTSRGYEGQPVAAVCADTLRQARRRPLELIDGRVGGARAAARPRRGRRGGVVRLGAARATSAATSSAASPRPTSSSRPSTARRSSCTTRWRPTSPSAAGRATTLEVYISTQYIWGVRDAMADGARPAGRQGARRLRRTWAAASARRTSPATTRSSPPRSRRRTGRPGARAR